MVEKNKQNTLKVGDVGSWNRAERPKPTADFWSTGISDLKSVRPMPTIWESCRMLQTFYSRMCHYTAVCSGKIAAEEVQRIRTSLGCGAHLLQAIPID